METKRFDVVVVGAGPAGAIAALVLARGGADVALVDKTPFPRDKACGDLVGPGGVQLLRDVGLKVDDGCEPLPTVMVVGPTGRGTRLPFVEGHSLPGHGFALPRYVFDDRLRDAALDAGAEPFDGRATEPLHDGQGSLEGFELSSGVRIRGDVVIGADGATSRVAEAAGLVDHDRVMWAFALRSYVDAAVADPSILLWDNEPGRGFPGYGWIFPGSDGRANLGLGMAVLADRPAAKLAARLFDPFLDHLRRLGLLAGGDAASAPRLGGWLKMGMVGTVPARRRVLLVGDAAGLVNPLQGEGIAQAMVSARAAAEAVLTEPARATETYTRFLSATFAPYLRSTAPAHALLLGRPRAVSATGRLVTAPGIGRAIARPWSLFWNDQLGGAKSTPSFGLATAFQAVTSAATSRTRVGRWFAG